MCLSLYVYIAPVCVYLYVIQINILNTYTEYSEVHPVTTAFLGDHLRGKNGLGTITLLARRTLDSVMCPHAPSPSPVCFSLHAFYPSLLNLQLAGQYKMVRLFICGLSSFNPLLASFCFSKTSSLPVQSTLPMPRSAEPRSRRAAKERERRAVEAPASHQAGLDTVKARDRRAAETPPPRQARLASDWLIATLLGTSYDFTHVRAPSESWTSPSLSPQESRRFGCSQDCSPRRTRRSTGAHFFVNSRHGSMC